MSKPPGDSSPSCGRSLRGVAALADTRESRPSLGTEAANKTFRGVDSSIPPTDAHCCAPYSLAELRLGFGCPEHTRGPL